MLKEQVSTNIITVGLPSIIMEQIIIRHRGKKRLDEDGDRIKCRDMYTKTLVQA